MDLRTLQHAIALAEESNFARAAEKENLSQSAMSRSIQALERELGLVLFDRTSQGTVPTAVGRQFLQRAQQLLYEARSFRYEMNLLSDGHRGELAFGAGPSAASVLLPTLLATAVREHPELCFRVEINNWEILTASLRRESIEFFIASRQLLEESEKFEFTPIGEISGGGFFCHPTHPLTGQQMLSLADIANFPLISTQMPESVQTALRQAFKIQANDLGPFSVICDNIFLLKQMLKDSEAVLYTENLIVAEDVAAGTLARLPLANPYLKGSFRWELDVVSLSGRTLSPAAVAIIKRMQHEYARLTNLTGKRS